MDLFDKKTGCITGPHPLNQGPMAVITFSDGKCVVEDRQLLGDLLYEIRQMFQSFTRLHEFLQDQHLSNCVLNDALVHARLLCEVLGGCGGRSQKIGKIVSSFSPKAPPDLGPLYGEICERLSHLGRERKEGIKVWYVDDFKGLTELSMEFLRHVYPIGDDALAFAERMFPPRPVSASTGQIGL